MKINRLLQAWPRGTVALHPWLARNGVSPKLAEAYRKGGWIDAVGRGAFVRRGETVGWPGAVYALQAYGGKKVHPGGRTALELHGYAHFLRLGEKPAVRLYGAPGERLPAWFLGHDWDATVRYSTMKLFARDDASSWTEKAFGDFSLRLSGPERAMLECLDGVPEETSFEEARLLMEGLAGLRPAMVQRLLEACRSVKVKRLFLFLADEAGHPWQAKLEDKRVDLGTGKRLVVRGGQLDPRFLITVPKTPQGEGL